VEVVALADTTVVLLAPGMGDGVQAAKAGILEVADVLAVNKADRPGARKTVRDLEYAIAMSEDDRGWTRPVVSTVAVRDQGVDDLVAALDAHRAWLDRSGARAVRRRARAAAEIEAIALEQVRSRIGDVRGAGALPGLADRVVAGELDPYGAADALLGTAVPADSP
jgi:LAO/AO transport system kinase